VRSSDGLYEVLSGSSVASNGSTLHSIGCNSSCSTSHLGCWSCGFCWFCMQVLAGTWNVNENRPSRPGLELWLGERAKDAQLVLIGLQVGWSACLLACLPACLPVCLASVLQPRAGTVLLQSCQLGSSLQLAQHELLDIVKLHPVDQLAAGHATPAATSTLLTISLGSWPGTA